MIKLVKDSRVPNGLIVQAQLVVVSYVPGL